jgi:hypothetical protein
MQVPDALSRAPSMMDSESYLAHRIRTMSSIHNTLIKEQSKNKELSAIISAIRNGSNKDDKYSLESNILCHQKKFFIPPTMINTVLSYYHDAPTAAHVGSFKMITTMTKSFYWPRMHKDIRTYIASCKACSTRRTQYVNRQIPKPALRPLEKIALQPFTRIFIDVLDTGKETRNGNSKILVVVDQSTRWIEAYPMPDARAETIANIIVNQWIARYGCPIFIHTDNATDFISNLNKETWRLMGITHQLATPYSP